MIQVPTDWQDSAYGFLFAVRCGERTTLHKHNRNRAVANPKVHAFTLTEFVNSDQGDFTEAAAIGSTGNVVGYFPIQTVESQAAPAWPMPMADNLPGAMPMDKAAAADTDDGWRKHRVVVFDGRHDTHIDDGDDYDTLTLGEVFDSSPANRNKLDAPAMIPSSYCRFDARKHEAQRQHGIYVALAGDIDTGNVPMEQVQGVVSEFVGDYVATLIYSSSGATEQNRKWRVIVPLAQAVTFDPWRDLQEAFFGFMEANGIVMDWAMARAGQPVYLPNVPVDKRDFQGEPLFHQRHATPGRGLTNRDGMAERALSEVHAARKRDESERQRVQQAAKQAMQARGTGSKSAVIDAFNQAYSIEQMLEANGYQRGPRDSWRSPYQSSKTFATKNFGDYWVSMSESDADAGVGAECASGRYGDAFDLFCHFDHKGDFKKAVRSAAKMMGLDKRPATDTPVDVSGIMRQADGSTQHEAGTDGATSDSMRDWRPPPVPPSEIRPGAKSTPPVNLEECIVSLDDLVDPDSVHPHVVEKLVPQGEVTLLAGHGAAGKSFIALLACVLVALGRPFGKLATTRSRVLFFSAEDDKAELQRRVARICRHLGVNQSELKGWLFLLDVSEVDPTLFRGAETDPDDQPTKLLTNLAAFVKTRDIGMSVIDNASDVFDGNEIVRPQVRAFIRNLRGKLARPRRAVILLAHVSKAAAHNRKTPGASTDEDYSGSTAWHNSVRSRLSLDTDDRGVSVLKHLKANKGPKADAIDLEWHDGAPTISGTYEAPGADLIASLRKSAEAVRDETDKAAIITIIQGFDWRKEDVPTAMQGPYSIFRKLKDDPSFPGGLTSDRLNRLVRELERDGKLYRVTRQTKHRKPGQYFTCAPGADQGAPNLPPFPGTKVA
jgi:hypothetical protein